MHTDKRQLLDIVETYHQKRILVVGDAMLDYHVLGKIKRLNPEAPTLLLSIEKETPAPGGAANVAANISALGGHCSYIGIVGTDVWGHELLSLLNQSGINTSGVVQRKDYPTIRKTRFIASGQHLLRADKEDILSEQYPGHEQMLVSIERALPSVDCIVYSDYAKGQLTGAMVRLGVESGKTVIIDPRPPHYDWCRGTTVFKPNYKDALRSLGLSENTPLSIARLQEMSQQFTADLGSQVVITLSEAGMFVNDPTGAYNIPTRARTFIDSTGAGDTVTAVLALSYQENLVEASQLANLAAGLVVEKSGTATVSLDELTSAIHREQLEYRRL